MPWRYFASFACWALGHAEPLWHCGERGIEWRCPDCQRTRQSVLRHLKPRKV